MPQSAGSWKNDFSIAIANQDIYVAVAVMDDLKTRHAGTPPQKVKDAAVNLVQEVFAAEPNRVYETGMALVKTENPAAKEIGIALLPPFFATKALDIAVQFSCIGDDENWEVREWAASALAHVIVRDFDRVHHFSRQWAAHPSRNVRRMVVVAAGYAMRDCTNAQCSKLLDMFAPVLADTDAYVSKNLGAYALGSYAIRYQAELVAQWAAGLDLRNEQTACNLAMMFTTAEAAKHLGSLEVLLLSLLGDERKKVRRAVKKALENLDRRSHLDLITILNRSDARGEVPSHELIAGVIDALPVDDQQASGDAFPAESALLEHAAGGDISHGCDRLQPF